MFTGIVRAVGRIVARRVEGDGLRFAVATNSRDFDDVHVGDSIAVNGCCLTVVAAKGGMLEFDASAETLACTTGFPEGGALNLEPALRLSDRLDGHLVSGHIDAIGIVVALNPVVAALDPVAAVDDRPRGRSADADASGGSHALTVDVPEALARFIAPKGSIAIDGVSLTTNSVIDVPGGGARFTVNLIPYTLAVTTLGSLRGGVAVNLEVDLVARYLDRLHGVGRLRDAGP